MRIINLPHSFLGLKIKKDSILLPRDIRHLLDCSILDKMAPHNAMEGNIRPRVEELVKRQAVGGGLVIVFSQYL